ncbi:MAG: putative phosphate transport regulator [Gemmatimonadetes bacterium]|jgi:predicted phosphate transport protein (TIGR00153 family)|nr:putative phosphate transport regulator [Gemmatimonadota bacterium]
MLSRLIPRDEEFFSLFNKLAEHLRTSAQLLDQLFSAPQRTTELVKQIKDVEHLADQLTLDISVRIDKSFITPIDREDIHLLASRLDDVIDRLDGTARRVVMLHINEVREPAKQMAHVIVRAADHIAKAVGSIKRPSEVAIQAAEIKKLEEEGDALYHEAVGALFAGTPDAIEVIRWKEVYESLETAIDQCMGVANAVHSISIKNS